MAKLSPRSISKRIARNPFCARQLGNVSVATDFKSDKERQGLGFVFYSSPDGQYFSQAMLDPAGVLRVNLGAKGDEHPLVLGFEQLPDGKHFLRGSLIRGNGSGHEIVAADLISCGGGTREFAKFPIDSRERTIRLIDPPKKYVPLVAMLDSLSRREGLSGQLDVHSVPESLYQVCFDAPPAYQETPFL